jgi:hypothetical protein
MARPNEAAEEENDPFDMDEILGLDDESGAAERAEEEAQEKLQHIVRAEYTNARDYVDFNVSLKREEAYKYYAGWPFGDEEEGRSQVVITEVRDKILGMMPSLVRVFTSGDKVVEYQPVNQEDIEAAEQATDYVNYLLDADGNNAFKMIYEALKDGLIKKTGVFTWRWETEEQVEEQSYTGLSYDQVQIMRMDPEVEILSESHRQEMPPEMQQAAASGSQIPPAMLQELQLLAEPVCDIYIRRTRKKGRLRVECIPPEQFLISREATCEDDAELIGRRRLMRVSDLVEMGVSQEQAERHSGANDPYLFQREALLRNPGLYGPRPDSFDPSQKWVLWLDCLVRVDTDGDGIAELHHVRAIGDNCEIVFDEIVSDVNYAVFCPNPEPHAVIGMSVADETMDLQFIKSHVMRATLDSLAGSIFPSLAVVEGAVDIDDALNTEMGRIIRMKAPGMVQPISEPFIGAQALGVMAYLDEISAARTGQSKASQGLDADVLQSTTKAAVTATLSASQERLEMIARIFAETTLRRMFRGILRTLIRHQDKPRMVRLRGKWTPIDPRDWNADMDVSVTVALGRGDEGQKMAFLGQIAQKQEQLLATMGPGNPLCDVSQLRSTYAEMLRIAGYKDASRFFKPLDQQQAQQMAEQAAQQKPPQDPTVLLAQVEAQKVQKDIEIATLKMQLEMEKAKAEDDRERDRNEADIALRAAEIQAKYGAQINLAAIQANIDRDRHAAQIAADERVGTHRNDTQAAAAAYAAQQKAAQAPTGYGGE